jgi:adenosine kinase
MAAERKKALIVGSIVFDVIFAVHGNIKNELHLKDGDIQKISMMFTAKNKEQYYGGTAGNIAYGLGMLGEKPLLHGVVGKDFDHSYKKHLEDNNVDMRILTDNEGYTATFYGISDEEYQQIGIFQPNAYYNHIEKLKLEDTLTEKDFEEIRYAIFSPGNGTSTRNHMLELRKKLGNDVSMIFDPSQTLSILYDKDVLKECLSLSDIYIGNETELSQMQSMFGYSVEDLLKLGLTYVIETRGEEGSIVYSSENKKTINSIKPKRIIETTGAGDAFRAGMLYGLLNGLDIYKACEVAALSGARSVEEFGGQLYSVSKEDLSQLLKN